MPVSIESVSLEGAFVVISHVVAFAIDTFEEVRAWQVLGSFKLGGV